jgi:hypothetical protein
MNYNYVKFNIEKTFALKIVLLKNNLTFLCQHIVLLTKKS